MDKFLEGFKHATRDDHAGEQWAAWSRQLSDAERAKIEAGGFDAGVEEGKRFLLEVVNGRY